MEYFNHVDWKALIAKDKSTNDDSTFYFKFYYLDKKKGYSLLITDFCSVWKRSVSKKTLIKEKKKYIGQLEVEINQIPREIIEPMLLCNTSNKDETNDEYKEIIFSINEEKELLLMCKNKIGFYSIKWKFLCKPIKEPHIFLKEFIMIPFIAISAELSRQLSKTTKKLKENEMEFINHNLRDNEFKELVLSPITDITPQSSVIYKKYISQTINNPQLQRASSSVGKLEMFIQDSLEKKNNINLDDKEDESSMENTQKKIENDYSNEEYEDELYDFHNSSSSEDENENEEDNQEMREIKIRERVDKKIKKLKKKRKAVDDISTQPKKKQKTLSKKEKHRLMMKNSKKMGL
eukprot:TRINITY_DN167_c3_g4_i2.p1 TRINITY_DN167_c3_g4~~TRINITY_DN167_c3_g4_i2.p1  ORF type:complete len:349 (+),score=97.86 TRINITY_DN167_c3_g4_i2:3-1049(+)